MRLRNQQPPRIPLRPVVLVADQDKQTAKNIGIVLGLAGFLALYASTASEALKIARKTSPKAIILNATLPGMGGAKLVRMLRAIPALRSTSILVLSVPSMEGLEVECFKSGADDFLIWGVNDLSALPLRLLRAQQTTKASGTVLEEGIVRVDVENSELFVRGRRVQAIPPREFALLVYLMRRSPKVASWTNIQRDVWETPEHALEHGKQTKTIAVHCGRLRQRLGVAGRYIRVRRGIGLQFKPD